MNNKEIQFVLRMRDEATATWNSYKTNIESGSRSIRSAFLQNSTSAKTLAADYTALATVQTEQQAKWLKTLRGSSLEMIDPFAKATDALNEHSDSIMKLQNVTEQVKQIPPLSFGLDVDLMQFGQNMEKMLDSAKPYFQQIQKGFSLIGTAANQQATREINAINKARNEAINASRQKKNAELERIDAQLNSEVLSEERKIQLRAERTAIEKKFAAEEDAIKEKFAQKEREAKEKAFQANKSSAILTAVMNTAEGVTKALAQGGFLAGIPMAAVIGAMGAAEVALIASQPSPQFHEGGTMGIFGERVPLKSDEHPAILRTGETVRTQEQEAAVRGQLQTTGNTFVFNFSGVVTTPEAFKKIIQDGMRQMGITDVGKYFVNQRSKIVLQ